MLDMRDLTLDINDKRRTESPMKGETCKRLWCFMGKIIIKATHIKETLQNLHGRQTHLTRKRTKDLLPQHSPLSLVESKRHLTPNQVKKDMRKPSPTTIS